MEEKDWEQRLKEKWYLWNYNKELGNYTTCENEVIDFIEQELDKAREEGRREYARELLDDYYQPYSDSIEIDVSEIQSELSKLSNK
jgi:hypothetical protein